jgi:hypothetical protein
MHLYVNLIALLLTVIAFGVFAAVALHGMAKDEADARRYTSALAWVWFALAVVVGVTTMRSAASPGEYTAVKAAYVVAVVLLGVNAALQMDDVGGRVRMSVRKGAMWGSGLLALLLVSGATLRMVAWGRSSMQLLVVRDRYRSTPGSDRVGVAESLLEMAGLPNRRMKRMLRSLEHSARRGRR